MTKRIALIVMATLSLCLLAARGATPPQQRLALGSFGRGPTVVLVHGLGSRSEHWLPMARDLARDHHVVLVDLPGHGLSGLPSPLTLSSVATMLDRALADLGDEPVILVGHSVGGLVCAEEALRAPERVRSLVLVETALRPQFSPADRTALEAALAKDFSGTLRATYESFGRDSLQGRRLAQEVSELDPAMLRPWITLALSSDVSQRAAQLSMPVLAIVAPHTWESGETWAACAESLGYARVPKLTGLRVDESGHFVMLDHPRTMANAVRQFARRHHPPMVLAAR